MRKSGLTLAVQTENNVIYRVASLLRQAWVAMIIIEILLKCATIPSEPSPEILWQNHTVLCHTILLQDRLMPSTLTAG